ncbi:MAG: flavin prenyltransferase UbiX [Planctomycetota bacterium]
MTEIETTAGNREKLPVIVGVTGASGIVYAQKLVQHLLKSEHRVLLAMSSAARLVIKQELPSEGGADPWGDVNRDLLELIAEKDFNAPFCSGTFRFHGMVIVPASMGTVGSIASGVSINVIHRGADVCLKERRKLVVVPRETPFSTIHLENLLKLSRAGAVILPPSPAFYQDPKTLEDSVDFIVSRILDALELDNQLIDRWGE